MAINNVVVCGVGAAGANAFLHILYTYPGLQMVIVDNDIVEDRNISPGTQPYTKTDLRRPKVQALARIAMQAKNKRIHTVNGRINSADDIRKLVDIPEETLVIDAFDNATSRNLFLELRGFNVLHIGFSGALTGEAVWENCWEAMTESPKDAAIDVCEMGLARPFIFALTALAGIVISRFIEKGEKTNMYFDSTLNLKSWN